MFEGRRMSADPDASGFLAEVLADPDNDVPRLIYADWLEEQGSGAGSLFVFSASFMPLTVCIHNGWI